jgi:hypothetical protein
MENEMRVQIIKVIAVSLLISISQIAVAFSDESMGDQSISDQTVNKYERWQMNLIYQPSQSTLDREGRGFVHIYDGFTDTQVNQIMDDKFERIDSMMFTSVKITDTEGAVLKDPMTGYELVEDDGCD